MCLLPIRASLPEDGGRPQLNPEGDLKLPCGKCHVCISKRALEWSTRVRHEISEHNENCFITLTYSPENLCSQFTVKSDFQKFIKKLRRKTSNKIKYMVSYEYGTKTFRPHMHAIIFGYTPPSQSFERATPSGSKLYTSPEIEKLWNKGFHSIGEANEKTAYYIATYALKGKEREISHPDTGESITIRDSMNVSKRPAIGLNFLMENAQQLVDSKKPLPRYYQKKLEIHFPELHDIYQERVQENLSVRGDEEAYAKYIIDTQKMSENTGGLRSDSLDISEEKRREFFKRQLKAKRDNYVTHNQTQKELKQ